MAKAMARTEEELHELESDMLLDHDAKLKKLAQELFYDPMDNCWYRWADHWKGLTKPCDEKGNYLINGQQNLF